MRKFKFCRVVVQVALVAAAATCESCDKSHPTHGQIFLNQVGYYPGQEKVAIVDSGAVKSFEVLDAVTRQSVLSGVPGGKASTPWSEEVRTSLDFSDLTTPGSYLLVVNGDTSAAMPFTVKANALSELADGALKALYYQRTAMPIEEKYAGKWSRPAAHPDTKVIVHPAAAGPVRKGGDVIASPKGWYDAGDYNKYIVNSGFTVGLMQDIYSLEPEYFAKQNVNIPESDNSTPDLLDELHYNLDWMLTMQDPADGGVYHKLTTLNFEGFITPSECKQERYVVPKSVTASLDFAAAMAQASRVYSAFEADYPGFSEKALHAAQKAYAWAEAYPAAFYDQESLTPAVTTGTYADDKADDEFFWASSELYLATGDSRYLKKAQATKPAAFAPPTWGSTAGLGVFAWVAPGKDLAEEARELSDAMKTLLVEYAEEAVADADANAFHAPYGNAESDFYWGSLSEGTANQGIALIYAYKLTDDDKYLENAARNMDYILGRNPLGYCYVTGFGTRSPMHPHHRLSASDGIESPIPGFLVGGPNAGKQDADYVTYSSSMPDEAYEDVEASYASNEIAINWNASLVALSSALDALMQ